MRFSRQLHATALASGAASWLARRAPARRILMLHGIDDLDMPLEAFERILGWLAARFPIVSLADLVDAQLAGRPVSREGELALTFDDGLHNQLELAYPVLRRLGVPATFFVCPGLIDAGGWIWTKEARCRLETLDAPARHAFAREVGARHAGAAALVEHLKREPIDVRLRHEARLRVLSPAFAPTELDHQRWDLLRWEDFEHLDPALITIGSHTLSHPMLPSIDDAALEHELVQSRRILEQRLQRRVDLFCYPNGAQDARVRAAVARTYRAAVSTEYGLIGPGSDVHRLERIPASPELPLMAWRLIRPAA